MNKHYAVFSTFLLLIASQGQISSSATGININTKTWVNIRAGLWQVLREVIRMRTCIQFLHTSSIIYLWYVQVFRIACLKTKEFQVDFRGTQTPFSRTIRCPYGVSNKVWPIKKTRSSFHLAL